MGDIPRFREPEGAYWDEQAAALIVRFFERALRHTVGEWAGQPFILQPWQKAILRDLMGWKRKSDGTRVRRQLYLEVPRKNGKSTLAAGLALYLLLMDGEPGAQVYSAAADRQQAKIIFDEAARMVKATPALARRVTVYKQAILTKGGGVYRVLSADVPTKHGLNASAIVFDELHAQPTRDLWDVLTTSTGARRQPLTIAITTAGWDRESICWEQHRYAEQVRDGIIPDDTLLPVIYAAGEDDDWQDEAVWAKANPNLGVSLKLDYLREQARRAKLTPAYENTFRRLHLDQWTEQATRWLPMEAWDACRVPFRAEAMEGETCYGGLDLASTSDIAALVLCFPSEEGERERYRWLPFFWIPEAAMEERSRRDRVPYPAWVRQGLIRATPGEVIDYDIIVRDIEELGTLYRIEEIAFDRWGAVRVSNQLTDLGFEMIGFGQGFASMAAPTRELLRLVLDRRLEHDGNAVLRWMASNVVVEQDAAGNLKPSKKKSREKIDGIVAGLMALDRAIRHRQGPKKSVYAVRGLRAL